MTSDAPEPEAARDATESAIGAEDQAEDERGPVAQDQDAEPSLNAPAERRPDGLDTAEGR